MTRLSWHRQHDTPLGTSACVRSRRWTTAGGLLARIHEVFPLASCPHLGAEMRVKAVPSGLHHECSLATA